MSRFLSGKYSSLTPYTPGEQPKERKYIKLNTNESPFPPSKKAVEASRRAAESLELYSDPEIKRLTEKIAEMCRVAPECVICTNGSDEILNFAFMAFCDREHPAVFPDITYGFYPVFAELNGVPYKEIPLREDFTVNVDDYVGINKNIFIANPNAPTGISISLDEIERIVSSNPDNIVVIDEAYVDFGGESAVALTQKYDNLLVTQTFSKSRSMAGARLGFAIGGTEIINDLHKLRYSTNPYNINRVTLAAGAAAVDSQQYYTDNCKKIETARDYVTAELQNMGFEVLPSKANFVFAKTDKISGEELYLKLKDSGILVRHFTAERIKEYNRITIGTMEQMEILVKKIKEITEAL